MKKASDFCWQEHGMDRPDHCSSGTFCAGDEPLDPDKMDQLSSDDRHVRNGTYDEAV